MKEKKLLFEAVATFVGTVIGAGILGVPYVIAQAGFWTGIFMIFILGIVSAILYLYLGETVLRTNGKHQLTGYAEKYLGKPGKYLMSFSMLVGIYGALIAYIIGEGTTFASLLGIQNTVLITILGLSITAEILFSIIFFIVMAIIIREGLDAVGLSEMYLLPIMIGIIIIISFIALPFIKPSNLTEFSVGKMLLPYGVIFFAYLGATAVPEMQQELIKYKKNLKKAIMIGVAIPFCLYILFATAVVGVSGLSTTQVATIGLGEQIGSFMLIFGNIFAMCAMATSFLALGLALQQMYEYDFKLGKKLSWFLTCFPPLGVALSGITSFVGVIALGGIVAGGIDGVLIILMTHIAKSKGDRKPEYTMPMHWIFSLFLITIFILGAGYYFSSLL